MKQLREKLFYLALVISFIFLLGFYLGLAQDVMAQTQESNSQICEGFGPQTPRDIDQAAGENKQIFSLAPNYQSMNLCNIHFHSPAEHKAKDFSVAASSDPTDSALGYQCQMSQLLTRAEFASSEKNFCKGVKSGNTIEVHWVYSSCDVQPGKSLNACLSEQCTNPNLRVETQVFVVVNNPAALNFKDFAYAGKSVDGYHQTKSLPKNTGKPIEFLGSSSAAEFTAEHCSPLQVSWSVRPQCAKVDINSLSDWCRENAFKEDYAYGVRKLVTQPKLLSKIEK